MALQRIPLHVRTVLIVAPQFVFTKRLFRNPPVPLMSGNAELCTQFTWKSRYWISLNGSDGLVEVCQWQHWNVASIKSQSKWLLFQTDITWRLKRLINTSLNPHRCYLLYLIAPNTQVFNPDSNRRPKMGIGINEWKEKLYLEGKNTKMSLKNKPSSLRDDLQPFFAS